MATILPTFPDDPSTVYATSLGGVSIRARLIWRVRTASWYLDIYSQDETPIIMGRRLVPGQDTIIRGAPGLPDGNIRCFGPYPYAREDLGSSLGLVFVSVAELAIVEAATIVEPVTVA